MNSKIEQLIEEIEDYIDSCKFKPLSSTIIMVNKEEIEELLRELKMKTPDEIKRYQKIISNKEAILNDARQKADALINEATIHTNELVNEHEIMQQAYAKANEIVTLATRQAQSILDAATMQANDFKAQALQYMDESLGSMEDIITNAMNEASTHYENLLNSMNSYKELIQSNRAQLYPVDALEEVAEAEAGNQET
ncbi:MAG: vacuolar family H+-ATPase subunit H [Lachnospiraceae bacterium]|nr:vacuolar family H+-ATPase subunit H [Lachnospiraceae bacterium]